jgi:peptidoglycan/LPS O-acetylase OafA/YrhL
MPNPSVNAPTRRGAANAAPPENGRYAGLDALRGVAALAVVYYHFGRRTELPLFFAHGYLAVDFFFALSGFVLARAYGARLAAGDLSFAGFCRIRAIRFLPLIVFGTLIAAGVECGRPGIVDEGRHLADTVVAFFLGSALVPILWPTLLEPVVFPLDGPVWSLFFEAVANAAFAKLARLGGERRWIAPILLVCAAGLLLGDIRFNGLDVGDVTPNFAYGFARVGWSFTLGLALYHVGHRAPRVPFALPALVLVAILLTPDLGRWNALFDAVAALLGLPLVVFLAAPARFSGAMLRLCGASGDLSYPLYATHYPLVRAFGAIAARFELTAPGRLAFDFAGTAIVLGVAYFAQSRVDAPARRRLSLLLPAEGVRREVEAGSPPRT